MPQLTIYSFLTPAWLYWLVIPVVCCIFTFAIPSRNVDSFSFSKKSLKLVTSTQNSTLTLTMAWWKQFGQSSLKDNLSSSRGENSSRSHLLHSGMLIEIEGTSKHRKKTAIWTTRYHTETLPLKLPTRSHKQGEQRKMQVTELHNWKRAKEGQSNILIIPVAFLPSWFLKSPALQWGQAYFKFHNLYCRSILTHV